MKFKERLIKKWCGRTIGEIHTLENELEQWKKCSADLFNNVDKYKKELEDYKLKEKSYSEHTIKIVPQYINFETFKMKIEMPDRDMNNFEEEMNHVAAQNLAKDLIEKGYLDYTEVIDPFMMKKIRVYEILVAKKG